MAGRIGIIDYGMGNLHSVNNACVYLGLDVFISNDAEELTLADGYILPGVGAFADAMQVLSKRGLDSFIKEATQTKKLLGICLGMQLLFDVGHEVETCAGLGLIPGEVVKLEAYEHNRTYKIPHMGWNQLEIKQKSNPLIQGLSDEKAYVYFVHSYKSVCADVKDLIAITEYGEEIAAVVGKGNVYGTQFHPEKSEQVGLAILRNFGAMI